MRVPAIYEKTNHEIQLDIKIPGGVEESEVDRYRDQLQTASFLSIFDPDTALAGLNDELDDEED